MRVSHGAIATDYRWDGEMIAAKKDELLGGKLPPPLYGV